MHIATGDRQIAKYIFTGLGALAAVALLGVSAAMNWRFGYSLGRTELDGYIYGSASVAADAFKALSPFFFFAAWRNRQWIQAICAAVVWVVTMSFAFTGATGHAALNRLDGAAKRDFTSTAYKDLRADYKRATDELSWVPAHRPAETVQSELNVLKAQRLWVVSDECKDANGKFTREFCQGFHKLNAELASGIKAEKIQERILEISGKLSKFAGGAPAEADPQAGILARVSGADIATMQGLLILLLVLLLEVGSGLGLYVAWAYFPVRASAARVVRNADRQGVRPGRRADDDDSGGHERPVVERPALNTGRPDGAMLNRAPDEVPAPAPAAVSASEPAASVPVPTVAVSSEAPGVEASAPTAGQVRKGRDFVREYLEQNPGRAQTSSRALARYLGVPKTTAWEALKDFNGRGVLGRNRPNHNQDIRGLRKLGSGGAVHAFPH